MLINHSSSLVVLQPLAVLFFGSFPWNTHFHFERLLVLNLLFLIEKLLPVQKLSAEAYKEQMAGSGKTLTALGSYWKGRF